IAASRTTSLRGFVVSSSDHSGPRPERRPRTAYGPFRSIHQRLIHRLPPQRSVETLRRDARHGLRHDHDDELFFGIDPESRARGAAAVVLSGRTRNARDTVPLANREAEPEPVAGR